MDRSELCPLIDSDGFVYACGFSADTQAIETWGTDGYLQEDYWHWAAGNINQSMERVLEAFKNAPWHRVYISGKGNYRETIASTLPLAHEGWTYKGNRDPLHKPKYFAEIRQHLIKRWGAIPVDGMETDDAACIEQFAHPDRSTCIVSVDKDLRGCPGHFYNPKKKVFEYVTLKQADMNFWGQVASGDSSDNIKGLKGIGVKTAAKILAECDHDPKRIAKELERRYIGQYGPLGRGCFRDTINLVWMLRKEWEGYFGDDLRHYLAGNQQKGERADDSRQDREPEYSRT